MEAGRKPTPQTGATHGGMNSRVRQTGGSLGIRASVGPPGEYSRRRRNEVAGRNPGRERRFSYILHPSLC